MIKRNQFLYFFFKCIGKFTKVLGIVTFRDIEDFTILKAKQVVAVEESYRKMDRNRLHSRNEHKHEFNLNFVFEIVFKSSIYLTVPLLISHGQWTQTVSTVDFDSIHSNITL